FRRLEKQAGKDVRGAELQRFADVRYAGQSYELTVAWGGDFHKEHQRVYGYSDARRPTETVTLRVRAVVRTPKISLKHSSRGGHGDHLPVRRVWTGNRWRKIVAVPRESLPGAL